MISQRGGRPFAEINVTPLVDVALVLLIIFMVTAPMIIEGHMPVRLPRAATGEQMSKLGLVVSISADGTVEVGGKAVSRGQIAAEIKSRLSSPELPVIIRGDESVPYGVVATVLDAAREAGALKLALASRQAE